MKVRLAEPGDETHFRAMYDAQRFEYAMPKLGGPNIVVKRVATDEGGTPRMGIFGRRTLEAFFFVDKNGTTPQERYDMLLHLGNQAEADALALGYEDVQALLAPPIERSFGRRLRNEFGWGRNKWTCYSKEL